MPRRISERGNRRRQRLRADDVRARAARARPTSSRPTWRRCRRGADSPFARLDDAAHRARAALPRARAPGPEADEHRHAAECAPGVHEHDRRRPRPVPGRARRSACRRPTSGGGAAPAIRGARTAPRSARACARIQATPGLFQSAMPNATVGEVREALALRERVIDFAVEAQGLDAADAAGPLPRDASDARPPAERPAPRAASRRDIDLADIQGNVLRGYTMPAAAYLFLRIVDVDAGARADDADAAAGGDRGAVERRAPATAMNVAFTFAGPAALGLPRRRAGVLPGGVPRGDGRARRAARRPRAERARAVGARARHRRRARARHGLRRRRRAPARGAAPRSSARTPSSGGRARAPPARRGAGRRPRPLRLLRRDRPARGARARASTPRPGDGQPDGAGGWRELATGEVLLGYARRGRHAARRAGARRSSATARSSSTASWRWTSAAFRRYVAGARRYPGGAGPARGQDRRPLARRHAARASRPSARTRRSPATRCGSTTSATRTTPTACSCPLGAHIRRANPRDATGFFDGRLSNRHRIVRRGRAYGPPLAAAASLEDDGADRGLVFVCFQADIWRQFETIQALWIDDGDPFGLGARQGLPGRRAARHRGQDDDPGPPAVLPQAAAALRDACAAASTSSSRR